MGNPNSELIATWLKYIISREKQEYQKSLSALLFSVIWCPSMISQKSLQNRLLSQNEAPYELPKRHFQIRHNFSYNSPSLFVAPPCMFPLYNIGLQKNYCSRLQSLICSIYLDIVVPFPVYPSETFHPVLHLLHRDFLEIDPNVKIGNRPKRF